MDHRLERTGNRHDETGLFTGRLLIPIIRKPSVNVSDLSRTSNRYRLTFTLTFMPVRRASGGAA